MAIEGSMPTFSIHGNQNLEIAGGGTSVWQTVSTMVGQDYRLTFYHTPRAFVHTYMTVRINSNSVATFDEDGSGLKTFQWMRYTTNFTADSTSTTICFSETPAIGAGAHIDNVVLERLPVQVGIRVSEVELKWETVENKRYQVQYQATITPNSWVDFGDPFQGNGSTLSYTAKVPEDDPQRFFRIVTVP